MRHRNSEAATRAISRYAILACEAQSMKAEDVADIAITAAALTIYATAKALAPGCDTKKLAMVSAVALNRMLREFDSANPLLSLPIEGHA
jgi:hypothetical protein